MGTGPQTSPDATVDVSIDKVWGDAWAVYKLLLRRSILTAAIVYALVDATRPINDAIDRRWASVLLGLLEFVLYLSGPVLVQGALVEIVRDIHVGRAPKRINELYRTVWRRTPSLVWASIVYGVGVIVGLVLLIVPGLRAASRWCLMAPLIVLEDEDAGVARDRSRELVRPYTWPVLGVIVATYVGTGVLTWGAGSYVGYGDPSPFFAWVITLVASSLTAPFYAHVLTVLYYRITEPGRPVIHPDVRTWRSVWAGG